jgi:hypothetical protein
MKITKRISVLILGVGIVCISIFTVMAYGHCDTMSGPVAVAAGEALKNDDFKTIQIWVGREQQEELKKRFDECLAVHQMGGQASDLANRYFIETAIRLHRQAEGMSFTGVKPAQPLPSDVEAAERALEAGDVKIITDMLTKETETQTKTWFDKAMEAKKHKDESEEAGRKWVDAYVKYVVYVHGLHQKIKAEPQHGVGE